MAAKKQVLLSVVLAVFNEEANLKDCLESIKEIADEIVIVDGGSSDKTLEIARHYNSIIIETNNPPIFHINKQKALDAATGKWVLQLDADERVSPELAKEIVTVVKSSDEELDNHTVDTEKYQLLYRHLEILSKRDGYALDSEEPITAFMIPRRNYFLGSFLYHGGVYPDGTIRLVRKGAAHFRLQDVHDQMIIEGRISFLSHDLIHMADPDFSRYLKRSDRYTTLLAKDWFENYSHPDKKNTNTVGNNSKTPGVGFFSIVKWIVIEPKKIFISLYFRHQGYKDGFPGFVWALYSSLHIATSYIKYWEMRKQKH